MYFASNLSYLRKEKSLTQEELSKEIGMQQQTISNYESESREPNIEGIIKIARFFQVSIDDLLTKDMQPGGLLLGRNLRYLRKGVNAKAAEIAAIFKVNAPAYSKYENGLVQPKIEGLIAISEFFGVTVDDLLKKDLSKEG